MIIVKADMETVKRVSKRETTNPLVSDRNWLDISGKIRTKQEKIIARPELIKKTGKLIFKPRNWEFLMELWVVERVVSKLSI